jgi:hypothetical protein
MLNLFSIDKNYYTIWHLIADKSILDDTAKL